MTELKKQKNRIIYRLTAIITTVSLFSYMLADTFPVYASEPKEIIVAVIDTGINTEHSFLKDNIWFNEGEIPGNGIDDDGNGFIDDVNGWDFYNNDNTVYHDICYESTFATRQYEDDHGTAVAGMILQGAEKVCASGKYKIKIMSVKFGSNNAYLNKNDFNQELAVKAIEYAEKNGASICNLSWGGLNKYDSLEKAISNSKMLFVCSAGNDGTNNESVPQYPASYSSPNVLSVTYADVGEDVKIVGNVGRNSVDVCTHGIDVWTSFSHGMGYMTGSSFSAAEVSGYAAALMANTKLNAEEVAKAIIETSDKSPEITGYYMQGGLCNPAKIAELIGNMDQAETVDDSAALLLNYNEISIECGKGFILKPFLLPAGSEAEVTFELEDILFATFSYNGVVIGKNKGDVSITVKTKNGTEGSCLVHVYGD
ncbi:MAG: S8 family serine peptidase [Lachnospiraceae bacterium]|nr:S8 family serine peptidase [Lachnospiraceae bacterium]